MMKAILLLAMAGALPGGDEFERDFAYIVPKKADLIWREIPWKPVFWDGVVEAHEKQKPILLWAMNGHPMACT